jgi:transposase
VLERIQDHPANRIGELMPWEYHAIAEEQKAESKAKYVA